VLNQGDSVVLSGTLADQASIDALVTQARAQYGADNVVNRLNVGNGIIALSTSALDGMFANIAQLGDGGKLTLNDGVLRVTGEVANADTKASIGSALSRLLSAGTDQQLKLNNQLTIKPVEIARDVCEDLVAQLLSTAKINFASGKAIIQDDSFTLLGEIATTARRCQGARFEVAGHTDSIGNLALNMSLSEKRAQAVVDHLVGLGLDAAQFSASGYGPNSPIADNGTNAGRAKNRRIEFKLIN